MDIYTYPFTSICNFFACVKRAGDHEKQDAIQRMTELTVTQERIVPLMRDNDRRVMEIVVRFCALHPHLCAHPRDVGLFRYS